LLWGADESAYEELVKTFKDRLGAAGMEERYQNELQCLFRHGTESLRELAQDVRRIENLYSPEIHPVSNNMRNIEKLN